MGNLFLPQRFYLIPGTFTVLFMAAYLWPDIWLFIPGAAGLCALVLLFDLVVVFGTEQPVSAQRSHRKTWGLGDEHPVNISLHNHTDKTWNLRLYDEQAPALHLPGHSISCRLAARQALNCSYHLKAVQRGRHDFGLLRVFISSPLGLVQRRLTLGKESSVNVFPSVAQMKQYSLHALPHTASHYGLRKQRKLGHGYEFEHIREYRQGDDARMINQSATARRGKPMVNQYGDEQAQQVYCILDKSRMMHAPFRQMSLLDYAINSSLTLCNLSIQKYDKAGLMTFSDVLGRFVPADRKPGHMRNIQEALYQQQPRNREADFELLYRAVTKLIRQRSLLVLFTHFDSLPMLEEALPLLRKLRQKHLLLCVMFENTELQDYAYGKPATDAELFGRAIAQQFLQDQWRCAQMLQQHGIQNILCPPDAWNLHLANKYLAFKAKGLI